MNRFLILIASLALAAGCRPRTAPAAAENAPAEAERETFVYAVKQGDTLRLDRYAVPHQTTQPCLIFAFGGGFVNGSRDDARYVPFFRYLAEELGYTVVSIDYRLGIRRAIDAGTFRPENLARVFPETIQSAVEDFASATGYVLKQAAAWRIDPARIVASGSSAGAITALCTEYALCNPSPLRDALPGFNYAGVISFAGAIFAPGDELHWSSDPAPMLFFHGDADRNVPYDAIREMGAGFFGPAYITHQLDKRESPYYFYAAQGVDHALCIDALNDNHAEVELFLQRYVAERQPLRITATVREKGLRTPEERFTLRDYLQANFAE